MSAGRKPRLAPTGEYRFARKGELGIYASKVRGDGSFDEWDAFLASEDHPARIPGGTTPMAVILREERPASPFDRDGKAYAARDPGDSLNIAVNNTLGRDPHMLCLTAKGTVGTAIMAIDCRPVFEDLRAHLGEPDPKPLLEALRRIAKPNDMAHRSDLQAWAKEALEEAGAA